MKVRVFTLRLDVATGAFDDAELQGFFATRDALDVSEHFFAHDGVPGLALVVRYREAAGASVSPRAADSPVEIESEHRALFDVLRRWRNDRAKRDGRPPYVLFTNAQLAAMARARPGTKAALAEVEGIGEGRLRDYADDLLGVIGAHVAG